MFKETYMIKLFEQYNQYFFETDSDEYYSNNSIIFNDNEIIQITEHLKRIGFDHIDYPPTKNFVYCDYTISDSDCTISDWIVNINIDKIEDEWYYVDCSSIEHSHIPNNTFYKCDQIEGLIKCLTHIKSILV